MSQLNDNENRLRFAYWVPNVSGGLVVSKIPQRTGWDYEYNRKLAGAGRGTPASNTRCRRCATWPATGPSSSTSRPASAWRCCWPPSG
jgi:hypothetical protein